MWWPEIATADAVSVRIKDDSTILATLTVNQAQKSAQWVKLSTSDYTFSSGTAVIEVVSQGGGVITAADAVRFVPASFSVTEFYYDIAGRVLRIAEDGTAADYYYDSIGRLNQTTDQNSRDVQYDYDNLGRRTQLVYPDNTSITYVYDKMSRLTDIKYTGGNVIAHYDYDELSRRTALYYNYDGDTSYNGTNDGVISYDYEDKVEANNDNLGNRLESVNHDINNDGTSDLTRAYTYDAVGNCQTKVVDNTETRLYLYDNTYQLTQDQITGGDKFDWVYDAVGSWDTLTLNDTTQTDFSSWNSDNTVDNVLNQYGSIGPSGARVNYSYDGNGNLTSDGTYTYVYDPENRLTDISDGTTLIVSYGYDALGRRISKIADGITTQYCYDGDQVVAVYEGGNLSRKFIYGPGIDEPICMIVTSGAAAGTYFYHQDALGSVVALSQFNSSAGEAAFVEKYSYSAFGQTTVTLDGSTGNPYRFTGREYESEIGLYYYRARFYNPAIGRFLQTDPIGYADSMNMYAYCGNNPLVFTDPSGQVHSGLSKAQTNISEKYIGGERNPKKAILRITLENSDETLKYTINSATEISNILSTINNSGGKISIFDYQGHGFGEGIGLSVGVGEGGLVTFDTNIPGQISINDIEGLIKKTFASNAVVNLRGCYTAFNENSIAYKFKNILPEADVYGYTGKALNFYMLNASISDYRPWEISSKWIKVKGCPK